MDEYMDPVGQRRTVLSDLVRTPATNSVEVEEVRTLLRKIGIDPEVRLLRAASYGSAGRVIEMHWTIEELRKLFYMVRDHPERTWF